MQNKTYSENDMELMRRTIARGASEDELLLFVEQCQRTGLDPFARQIYSVRRKQWNGTSRSYEEAQVIQVSIDGFRVIADRSNKYSGQVGPFWCGQDGQWKEVWLEDVAPAAARVGVLRSDFSQPLYSIALLKSYIQTNAHGEPVSRWKTDPAGMLAKCAESLALRRAFPHELSGLYTTEEMGAVHSAAKELKRSASAAMKETGATQQPDRPFSPDQLRSNYARAVASIEQRGLLLGPNDYELVDAALTDVFDDDGTETDGLDTPREKYLEYVSGVPYLEDMGESQIVALLRLLKPTLDADANIVACAEAQIEAHAVVELLGKNQNETPDPAPAVNPQPAAAAEVVPEEPEMPELPLEETATQPAPAAEKPKSAVKKPAADNGPRITHNEYWARVGELKAAKKITHDAASKIAIELKNDWPAALAALNERFGK